MSRCTFTRIAHRMCALLLLAVVGVLLPTHRVAADEQIVSIPKGLVDESVWRVAQNANTPTSPIKLLKAIQGELLARAPLHDEHEFEASEAELEQRTIKQLGPLGADLDYQDNLPLDEIVRAVLDAANSMPTFKPYVAGTWKTLVKSSLDNEAVYQGLLSYSPAFLQNVPQFENTAQAEALERAKSDPQFATAYDNTIGKASGVSIKNVDANTILAAHPDLPIPQQIRDAIGPDGTLTISLGDLKNLATNEFGKINDSIGDLQVNLDRITLQQKDLVEFMKNQQARQEAEALAKAKAQEHQLKLQAADSALSIVSTLAGFIDPKVGNQIATVGHSALQIGESLNSWMGAVAGLSTLDKVTSLSTVVMTGNVLSAVSNVMGLFGTGQPSPDQVILQEIGKLRQQVDQLRTEMHDRFDHVDQELNTIYTTMQDRFDKIDVQLGKITVSLDEIQQTLDKLSLDLSRIERDNFEFLDALGRRPLRDAINGAVGYKQRTGIDMPYQPDFVGYENTFHTWGTVNAFDALSAGPTQRDYSDGQVLTELNAYPLDANLNYLNGWLQTHGMTPFATKRLASPRDWAFASRAYADIGFDWPASMKRIDPQRQAALDAVGNDLETAMHNISTIDTPNGPQGNAPLFNGLLAYYDTKLKVISDTLQTTENAYVQEVQGRLQRDQAFNLFGGVDQTLAYQAPEITTMTCGGLTSALSAPSALKAQTPNFDRYNFADYVKLGTITTCASGKISNVKAVCQPGKDACDTLGDLQMFVTVMFNNVSLTSRTLAVGRVLIPAETTPSDYVINHWDSLKARFEIQATEVPPTPALVQQRAELLTTTTTGLQNKLHSYQQELYGRVVNALSTGAQHPAAVELAGATKLLDSFVTLGFPQAVDNDDFMRSLLFSDQQLPDDQQIIAAYAASITAAASATAAPKVAAVNSDTQLTTNPRLTMSSVAQKRRDALSGLLKRYLDSISAQTYREDTALVADTRLDLRLARSLADTGSPTSPDQPMPTPTPPTPTPTQPTPGQTRSLFLPFTMH